MAEKPCDMFKVACTSSNAQTALQTYHFQSATQERLLERNAEMRILQLPLREHQTVQGDKVRDLGLREQNLTSDSWWHL